MRTYDSLDDALAGELQHIEDFGSLVNSRGASQKEVICRSFRIDNPTMLDIHYPSRKFNIEYAIFEWLWYISRDRNVKNISKLAKIWGNIKDEDGNVESNYGHYMFDDAQDASMSQWEWCKSEMLDDIDSRRATIPINQPAHKVKNTLDIPCTQYIQFFIRDSKLHLSVNMRSCDIIYGMCNDIFTFSLMQQLMLNELRVDMPELKLGHYYHTVGSLHLYKRHFNMSDNIRKEYASWAVTEAGKVELDSDFTYLDMLHLVQDEMIYDDLNEEQLCEITYTIAKRVFI